MGIEILIPDQGVKFAGLARGSGANSGTMEGFVISTINPGDLIS